MVRRLRHTEKGGWQWWVLAGIVALVAVLSVVTVFVAQHKHRHKGGSSSSSSSSSSSPISGGKIPPANAQPPAASVSYPPSQDSGGTVYAKYAEPLKISLQFFDIQKSGKLPPDNPIEWRGDSALSDGSDAHVDLSGGMYDAGDYIKFGFPMAFTATILSWSILEYRKEYTATQQLHSVTGSLKWITDYLIKAHASENELYFQVGSPRLDHACWERAEKMDTARPSFKLDPSHPGTEVAAETSAAMAAASLVFRNDDPSYAQTLLSHATQLFAFADKHRGSYTASFPSDQLYYNSTGFEDELLWAASWMFYATKDSKYLAYATGKLAQLSAGWEKAPAWFSWDDKKPGIQASSLKLSSVFLTSISFLVSLVKYGKTAEHLVCAFLPQSPTASTNRSTGGLLWVSQRNAVQHAVGSAFLAVVYADYLSSSGVKQFRCSGNSFAAKDLRAFAASQADYILGENPMSKSYLVGYGANFPQQLHHREASIPLDAATGCKDGFRWLHASAPNPHVATGALVGGPFQNDSYSDLRDNTMQNEATTYNSAAMSALLVALYANGPILPTAL
ncbi:hypothetical protein SELMODRAFT_77612 [Selaginella moellendorffii]|uniref:Endoglucanase n=1 Tax=Selaginella moellendorffii TaxID=88036 RepID=D8QRN0_SELML|nr:hypothetical protein SELMODRAFT_77612 [Selaginella moellendorffii]